MMPMLSSLSKTPVASEVVTEIVNLFLGGRDGSRFGVMNAATSIVRETQHADVRSRLETSGGGIPYVDLEAKHQVRRA